MVIQKWRRRYNTSLEIVVIEPSHIKPIGVGEATTTTTANMLMWLGLNEVEWLKFCNGTFKYGIEFSDWLAKDQNYWHVFEKPTVVKGVALPLRWLAGSQPKSPAQFALDCFMAPHIAKANLAPRRPWQWTFSRHFSYGYHINIAKHVEFLKQKCGDKITVIDDVVEAVRLNEIGEIESIVTGTGKIIAGDLFLDCTGFKSLLLEKTLKEPFESFSENLLCDRALAVALPPRVNEEPIKPYTRAVAMDSGWCWHIPLKSHESVGYVHAKNHIDPESALSELTKHLGFSLNNLDVRQLEMRVGQSRRAWVKNCIGIGLSGGFIEPLESTGNSFVEMGLVKLYKALATSKGAMPEMDSIDKYNQYVRGLYDEVKDFIVMHYYLTKREDTSFWRAVRNEIKIPETLLAKLEYLQKGLPESDLHAMGIHWFDEIFPQFSYLSVLAGMNFFPPIQLDPKIKREKAEALLVKSMAKLQKRTHRLINKLPDHKSFVNFN